MITDRLTRVASEMIFFFFNDTATTEIYTLSLHDALPISWPGASRGTRLTGPRAGAPWRSPTRSSRPAGDRKSTRLNSSHLVISYAVFCLKKKRTYNDNSMDARRLKINADRRTSLLVAPDD